MSGLDQLPDVAGRPVEDRMGPLRYILSPLLAHLAVVECGSTFYAGQVDQRVDAALQELVDGDHEIRRRQRRSELVERGRVPSVFHHEDTRFLGSG